MAGRYCTLIGGADYLEGEGTLESARAEACERVADTKIDAALGAWDRSGWFDGAIPPEVSEIALKYASGEYHRRAFNKASPDATANYAPELMAAGRALSAPTYAADLIWEADQMVAAIKARGFIVDADGIAVPPIVAGGGSMFPEIRK